MTYQIITRNWAKALQTTNVLVFIVIGIFFALQSMEGDINENDAKLKMCVVASVCMPIEIYFCYLLKECGFNIRRNDRQYIGSMNGPIDLQLVYQRQVDIVRGVLNSCAMFDVRCFLKACTILNIL